MTICITLCYMQEEILSEDQQLVQEQKRQMNLLQKNVTSLKSNLKLSAAVSSTKTQKFLHDNDYLLEQVNSLRQQVRHLTNENRMLNAREVFVEAKKISHSLSMERDDDYSEASLDSIPRGQKKKKAVVDAANHPSRVHSVEESLSSVGIPSAGVPPSVLTSSQFCAPPVNAASPKSIENCSDDGMIGSCGLSRDDIIAQTFSEQSSIDHSVHVVIKSAGVSKNQTAADSKIAAILESNQKLIEELNIDIGLVGSTEKVHEAFQGNVRSALGTPDINLSRPTTAEDMGLRKQKRSKAPVPPGIGKRISTHFDSKAAPLKFGGLSKGKKDEELIPQTKKIVTQKRGKNGMKLSASVNSVLFPPVNSGGM